VSRNNHNIDRHNQQFYKQTFTKAAFFFLRTLSSSRASSNVEVTFKTTKKNKKKILFFEGGLGEFDLGTCWGILLVPLYVLSILLLFFLTRTEARKLEKALVKNRWTIFGLLFKGILCLTSIKSFFVLILLNCQCLLRKMGFSSVHNL